MQVTERSTSFRVRRFSGSCVAGASRLSPVACQGVNHRLVATTYVHAVDTTRLKAVPLFGSLASGDLTAICAATSELDVKAGETVATEGDFGHALYAIVSGTAEVTSGGARLGLLGPGDVFGEIAVLASGRRTATVVATSPLKLIAFFKRDVWALEQQAPEVAARLRELIAERRTRASN
jgi:CRP-like cAMP-binding protein